MKVEIYSPPGCAKCGDRAFRYLIGTTTAYCRHHWYKLPGEDLVKEYEEHMDALRDQKRISEGQNKVLTKGLEDVLEKNGEVGKGHFSIRMICEKALDKAYQLKND